MNQMTPEKMALIGSDSRDQFKYFHKDFTVEGGSHEKLIRSHWGFDVDYACVAKYPARICGFFDYKKLNDKGTFAEAIGYEQLMALAPVFFIFGDDPTSGAFEIHELIATNYKPNPSTFEFNRHSWKTTNWVSFHLWEEALRDHTLSGVAAWTADLQEPA